MFFKSRKNKKKKSEQIKECVVSNSEIKSSVSTNEIMQLLDYYNNFKEEPAKKQEDTDNLKETTLYKSQKNDITNIENEERQEKEQKSSDILNLQIATPTVLNKERAFSSALKLAGLERYYRYYCKLEDGRIIAPLEVVKNVERMKYKIERGLEGEKLTLQALQRTPLDMLILKDLSFCYGDISTQIDFFVITSNCMIVIESKNWKVNLRIDSSGEFIDMEGRRWDNPVSQNISHKEFVCQLLPQFADKITSLIVWTNEKAVLERENAPKEISERIVYVKNLSNTILSIHRYYAEEIIDKENRNKIADAIISYCDTHINVKFCPICGNKLIKKQGKETLFWGCLGYKNGCKYTESIE